MYKEDLELDNLQWVICHKTQPTKPKLNNSQMSIELYYYCPSTKTYSNT